MQIASRRMLLKRKQNDGEQQGRRKQLGAVTNWVDDDDEEEEEHEEHEEEEEGQRTNEAALIDEQNLVAHIGLTSGGLAKSIELFGDYVARQIGLSKGSRLGKQLAQVSMDYLRGDKSHNDCSRDNLVKFISKLCVGLGDEQVASISEELVKELDACMVSYFAFHWKHSGHLLDQVTSGERKLKDIVIAATRKQRLQRAMNALKAKRAFATLVETIKAMGKPAYEVGENKSRRPVLVLVGGGMGAGKSTAVKSILAGNGSSQIRSDAVIVEADQFKEADVLYRALSSGAGDISMASQVVHDSSTRAASSLLVSALNEGRDVVFDGTMSWEPFVVQTVTMARDVHRRRYRLGPGYQVSDDGVVVERYWEQATDDEDGGVRADPRPAYRIELVAVTSDPLLAVVRGIRRAIITNRFVPIRGQLRSHKLFAASLEKYCEVVDSAKIFSTSRSGVPELIGVKEDNCKLEWVDQEAPKFVRELAELNPDASCVYELGKEPSRSWAEIALSPERRKRQRMLRDFFLCCTRSLDTSSDDDSSSGCSTSRSALSMTLDHCSGASRLDGRADVGYSSSSSLSSLSSSSSLSSETEMSPSSGSSSPAVCSRDSMAMLELQQKVEEHFINSFAGCSRSIEEDFLASLRPPTPQEDYIASFRQEQRVQEDFIALLR